MLNPDKGLSASQRAAKSILKDTFIGESEASYSKVRKPEAQGLPTELDGNYVP